MSESESEGSSSGDSVVGNTPSTYGNSLKPEAIAASSSDSSSDGYSSSSSSNDEDEIDDDRQTPVSKPSNVRGGSDLKQSQAHRGYPKEFQYSDSDDSSDFSLKGKDKRSSKSSTKKGTPSSKSSAKKQSSAKPKSTGPKTVPFDSVTIPMGDKTAIEKLINWRMNAAGTSEEILIKYKNMSFIHTEWVPRSVVEANRHGKMRLQRFLSKQPWEYQYNDDEPFNPLFVKVDRIIDEGENEDGIFYLVKWGQQTYDLCTWEPRELIERVDPDKIQEFHKRRLFNPAKQASLNTVGKRPSSKEWRVMEESPVYKNDNQLRSYQLEGLNWLLYCWYNNQNSILADEMGLGKTVQSTVFLDYIYQRLNVKGPFLIVTPLSTLGNWEREIKQWTDLNVVTEFYYRDAKNQIVANVFKFDILLTTYEMAISGMSQLKPIAWRCVVLDEAHKLKNKVLKQYKMEHRVLLTGTPLQNSVDELWSLLNFLEPVKFSSEKDFLANFNNLTNAADVEKLQAILKPLMLRRLKEDVEKSIPVKEETIIEVELTTMQKKWYRSILEKNFSWLKQGTAKRTNVPNLMNTMMELRKCCIHPFLLRGAEDEIIKEYGADTPEKQFSALVQASGKMVLIDKLLRKLKDGGHKVLIFSQMTKCLDLIQDYLRGQRWGFERIDGSIRGDLRQASIDRFSMPNTDTFIFLLCTRAGGVGINLTVADTVIIFDSDWNPQNDLQAQSRVHRIGQKKPVQIYRLVTRNTYEREMFDRASLKLGLDRAILQRMDAQSAYGAEEANDATKVSALTKTEIEELLKKGAYGAFMDDDASNQFCEEDIDQILQRRTHVIKHDNTAEKSSIFSKATFATNEEKVDLDDPDFWDKVAQKAQLNIIEVADRGSELIVSEPRQRRQVQRFGNTELEGEESENEGPRKDSLMMYGYAQWDKILELCRNRSVEDLKACSRALIKQCMSSKSVEPEVEADVKSCLVLDGIDDVEATSFEVPYPGATAKQTAEYRSFLRDAPKEYLDHLERKEKINPSADTRMPFIQGAPPAPWWGADEDRDLLIGTLHHGYQQYVKIAADPNLCFASKLSFQNEDQEERQEENGDDAHDTFKMEDGSPVKKPPTVDSVFTSPEKREAVDGDITQEKVEDEAQEDLALKEEDLDGDEEMPDVLDSARDPTEEGVVLNQFPSASDCGSRIRRIINAFIRNQAMALKDEQRRQVLEERARAKQEKEDEKVKLKERELTKKDRLEFYRTLVSYGVDYSTDNPQVRDWTRFKEISQLRKSTDVLEEYYLKLLSICHEILDPDSAFDPEKDYDSMTPDKAKKLLKRVASMKTLRDQVIIHPKLESLVTVLRKYGRNGLPEWWATEHDVAYLHGVAKWGLNRCDLYVEDDTLAFKKVYEQYLETKGQDPSTQLNRVDEGFWMKEAVAMKRFNSLCDSVVNPVVRRGGGGGVKRKKPATHSGSEADRNLAKKHATSKSRSRREPLPVTLPDVPIESPGLKRKRSDRGEKSKRRKRDKDSNEDTDAMLEQELHVKKKKKHKRKHGHREQSERPQPGDDSSQVIMSEGMSAYPVSEGQPMTGVEGDAAVHKKKKKHKKSSKLLGDNEERVEGKKKKSKSKKKHHSEGYISDSMNQSVQASDPNGKASAPIV
ncbi:SNF2 family N-terminal domain-containing protein [Chytridium lagenaria]|nr:SNF2 family N-terminal domain-containing protein [Chytridium lagenaria]